MRYLCIFAFLVLPASGWAELLSSKVKPSRASKYIGTQKQQGVTCKLGQAKSALRSYLRQQGHSRIKFSRVYSQFTWVIGANYRVKQKNGTDQCYREFRIRQAMIGNDACHVSTTRNGHCKDMVTGQKRGFYWF